MCEPLDRGSSQDRHALTPIVYVRRRRRFLDAPRKPDITMLGPVRRNSLSPLRDCRILPLFLLFNYGCTKRSVIERFLCRFSNPLATLPDTRLTVRHSGGNKGTHRGLTPFPPHPQGGWMGGLVRVRVLCSKPPGTATIREGSPPLDHTHTQTGPRACAQPPTPG